MAKNMFNDTSVGCCLPLMSTGLSPVITTNNLLGGNGIALSWGWRLLVLRGGAGAFGLFLTGVSLSLSLGVSHANMQYVSVFRFFLGQGRVSRPRPPGPHTEVEGVGKGA